MNQVVKYANEVREEVSRVEWPKKNEVVRLTLVVIVMSTIVGAYVGGLDLIFTNLLDFFLKI